MCAARSIQQKWPGSCYLTSSEWSHEINIVAKEDGGADLQVVKSKKDKKKDKKKKKYKYKKIKCCGNHSDSSDSDWDHYYNIFVK